MIRVCEACGAQNRIPDARVADVAKCGRCKAALSPDHPVPLGSAAAFDALLQKRGKVLVDFWAPWCGPCRAVAPELDKLAKSQAGRVVVAKLDTDAVPEIAARYDIRSIPTMILFEGGRETKRASGAMREPQIARAFGL